MLDCDCTSSNVVKLWNKWCTCFHLPMVYYSISRMKWNLRIGLVCLSVCLSVRPLPLIAQKPLIALIWFLVGCSGMSHDWCPSFRNFEKIIFGRLRGVFVPRGGLCLLSAISLKPFIAEVWFLAWYFGMLKRSCLHIQHFEKIVRDPRRGGLGCTPGESLKPFTVVN